MSASKGLQKAIMIGMAGAGAAIAGHHLVKHMRERGKLIEQHYENEMGKGSVKTFDPYDETHVKALVKAVDKANRREG